jgi:hypothetical protein
VNADGIADRLAYGILIFAEPSKETPAIVLAVCSAVAVVALPLRDAVIIFAVKFLLASLATIAFAELFGVALDVIVGSPDTPSALDTEIPIPETAIERVAAAPVEVLAIIPLVDNPAIAVRSESSG